MEYRDFFWGVTGDWPYPYQERLADSLLAGDSLILRAPTGAGKTWATIVPFLYARWRGKPVGDRLLYALPLRALASSLHVGVVKALKKRADLFGDIAEAGKDRDYRDARTYCSLQIGGQKNDPFFESDLIFITIDQLLSGYLMMPVSLPRRLDNMNAGALVGSMVVIDEAHLLEPDKSLGTMIEMLDRLKSGLARFVVMTATMSDAALEWVAHKLSAKVLRIPEEEVRALQSQRTKERTWERVGRILSWEDVWNAHRGDRTIALLNGVERSQNLFEKLDGIASGTATKVFLLHSRFYREDRERTEGLLPEYFGPHATRSDVILVTTQVIEAGMDISADHLHTEIAPMNALIQRAGRVARYPDRSVGRVTVYDVVRSLPYKSGAVWSATKESLAVLPAGGQVIDYSGELKWIDAVHASEEKQQLGMYESLYTRRTGVNEAMDTGNRALLSELIRDVDSLNVIVTDEPGQLNFTGRLAGKRVGWPRMLGIPRVSLFRLSETVEKETGNGRWVVQGGEISDGEEPEIRIQWKVIGSEKDLRTQWLVAIHPDYASYGERVGLRLGRAGLPSEVIYDELPPLPRYSYDFESWAVHARRITEQARELCERYRCAVAAIARWSSEVAKQEVTETEVLRWIELTCALHDFGKLTTGWQRMAWRWQRDKDSRQRAKGIAVPTRPDVCLAHTEFDAEEDWKLKKAYQFPPHAVEGAYAIGGALVEIIVKASGTILGPLVAQGILSAIARHHGPRASNFRAFELHRDAIGLANICVTASIDDFVVGKKERGDDMCDVLARFGGESAWPVCMFLVRLLRLADQGSLHQKLTVDRDAPLLA